jgi:O-antigen/teichoic acid export membrane protein
LKRKFITNLGLLIFLNLLVKPFWMFGIDRGVQNAVGSAEYGLYFALFNFSLILNILLDLGITNYNNRNIAMHNQLLSKHLSNVVVLKLLLAIVYAVVCFSVAFIIGYDSKQIYLLLFLVFNQFLLSFIMYLRSNLSALHLFRTDSFISVLDRFIMILVCSLLLWGNLTSEPMKIEWFVYAQTSAYVATAIVSFFIVFSKLEFFSFHYDRTFFIAFLKQSYPFALLILLMAFYNRIDSVMLERMLPDGNVEAGIYAQSFRVLDAASMFAFLFAGLLLPIFSKLIKNREPVNEILNLSYRLIFIPAIIFVAACLMYGHDIMQLLYHQEHQGYSGRVFMFLIPGFIAISTTYIYGTLLTANGNLKYLNILALCAMLLNIILNLILIPEYKALGSALSSLITQFIMAVGQVLLVAYYFRLKINYTFIVQILFFIPVLFLVAWMTEKWIDEWLVGFLIILCSGMAAAFIIRLINLRSLYLLIKNREEE